MKYSKQDVTNVQEKYRSTLSTLEKDDDKRTDNYHKDTATRQFLEEVIKNMDYLRYFDKEQRDEALSAMYKMDVQAGQVIFEKGSGSGTSNMYVIEKGKFIEFKGRKVVGVLGRGVVLNIEPLIFSCKKTSTVIAKTAGTLWVIAYSIWRNADVDLRYETWELDLRTFRSIPMMKDLTDEEIEDFYGQTNNDVFGGVVVKEGESLAFCLAVIELGEAIVSKNGREICRLYAGDYFGEEALVREPSRYTVSTIRGLRCDFLPIRGIYKPGVYEKVLQGYKKYGYRDLESKK